MDAMAEIDNVLINEIVRRITESARPDYVILFGSAASGSMTPDSDIDLLVLIPDVLNSREEGRRLRASLAGIEIPIDIVVMRTDRFEETKDIVGGIAYPASKYGKVIYEAA